MGLFDSSSTQTNAPWKVAQPYIQRGMKTAGQFLTNKSGFKAPTFQTYTPMSSQTQAGLGSVWNAAQGGNPLAPMSEGAISGILGGDINNKYNALYGQAGDLGMGMDQKYNDLYGQVDNPHFEAAVQNQADRLGNDVQRQFSGLGRTGSAADTGALVDQIGNMRTQALSDNWNQNVANRRGILGDQGQNRNAMLASQQGILGQQVQGQLGAVGQAGEAYNQRFLPGQAMGQVGAAYDAQAQKELDARIAKFNTNQNADWNRLNAYNAAISGNTQGTGQSTTTTPFNWGGALAGLGLAGASAAAGAKKPWFL